MIMKNTEKKSDYIVEMRNITKVFPGIKANDNITLQLKRGEIHALLGENGAGKSTLMSVLFGLYQPDEGQIYIEGEPVTIRDPNDATKYHIGMVHQHFKLVECFTVLENIILGNEDSRVGFITKKVAREKATSLMEKYGLHVDLDAKISDITVGMQQRTEILKMLFRDNEVLIFDEPTAVLTPNEIDELMKTMKFLASEGKSILFISHKLNEIKKVSDRCSVLRKGAYIGTVETKSATIEDMAAMMVGRNVSFAVDKAEAKPGKVRFKVEDLTVVNKYTKKHVVNKASIEVKSGEIVALAGIDGNGQSEFVQAITGLIGFDSGKVTLNDVDITHSSIRDKINDGLSHIPEDRHKHGLILDYNLDENFVLERYKENTFSRADGFLIDFTARKKYSEQLIREYDVRCSLGGDTITRSMSGGNQQKAIVAREIDKRHSFLIACQPTRGLDVGAIEGIHKKIVKDRDEGKAVLLVSLEMDEVLNLADRIYVMYEGEIVCNLRAKDTNAQDLGLYMAGAKRQKEYEKSEEELSLEHMEQEKEQHSLKNEIKMFFKELPSKIKSLFANLKKKDLEEGKEVKEESSNEKK